MEIEGLLTSSKWAILEEIAKEGQSPLQLSKKLNTSVANISQQLRLLEVAGIVTKQRLRQRERGKPRVVYSLKEDMAYIVHLAPGFANKRLLTLDSYHTYTLQTWFLADSDLHIELAEFYWKINSFLPSIKLISLSKNDLVVYTRSGKESEKTNIAKLNPDLKSLKLNIKAEKELSPAKLADLYVLFDPDGLLSVKNGGDASDSE